jgi:hypothetical protein
MITFRLLQKIIDNASYERQKQRANNNLYHLHIRHFACRRRSVLPPRPFSLTEDKIVLGELGAIRLAGTRQTRHSVSRVGW